jgi:VWFA-related protein
MCCGNRRSIAILSALLLAELAAPIGVAQVPPVLRTVYVSAVDDNGKPVINLTAADLVLEENGRTREIVSVQRAGAPLRVAFLVADGGTGAFQQGIARFIAALVGSGEFALFSIVEQPELIVDFTDDVEALVSGIRRMGQRTARPGAGQLMEAILDTARTIHREGWRSVIVVTRTGGESATSLRADVVREALREHDTLLYVVSPRGADVAGGNVSMAVGSDPMAAARGQYANSELATRGIQLNLVLNDGARESGGRHDAVVASTLVETMERMAAELINAHEVVYLLPPGTEAGGRLSIASTRRGVTVHAPTRIGN